MNKININQPLTDELIKRINYFADNEKIIIVFKNTKNLKIEDIKKFNSNVIISITGGLDPQKTKFNNEHYQRRTYYTPLELANIINVFEKIERQLNPFWNELEKCMFIYKSICEYSNYEECIYNGRDASRNLLGMITRKSVCSGYAIIFKEAMDRIGIKCYYQNRKGHHSWNAVEINNNLYAIELTWDTYNKKNNQCGFRFFCRDNKKEFYSNKHHNISNENEEQEFDFKEISKEVLERTLSKISIPKIYIQPTNKIGGIETARVNGKNIIIQNNTPFLKDGSPKNTFIRDDNSSFLIISTNVSSKGINEYIYLVYCEKEKIIKATKIYSEMNLLDSDIHLRKKIANNLLSSDRVKNKINNFNGYVGYVTKNSYMRYYDERFEESLNIHR